MSELPFTIATKRIPRNATNKECERPLQGELQTTAQGNKRGHKQMENYSMLMVRKNQYHENGHTVQGNLSVQCYPHQATTEFLHRIGKNHLKYHIEQKRAHLAKRILSKRRKKIKLEASHHLTSIYTTRLQ